MTGGGKIIYKVNDIILPYFEEKPHQEKSL